MTPVAHTAIEQRLRYMGEAEAIMGEVRSRFRGSQHYLRRLDHKLALDELRHLISEAARLQLHLSLWDQYMRQPAPPRPTPPNPLAQVAELR